MLGKFFKLHSIKYSSGSCGCAFFLELLFTDCLMLISKQKKGSITNLVIPLPYLSDPITYLRPHPSMTRSIRPTVQKPLNFLQLVHNILNLKLFSIRGLAAPCTGDRSCMTSLIHSWSRSHLTYRVAADSKSASSLSSLPQLLLTFLVTIN